MRNHKVSGSRGWQRVEELWAAARALPVAQRRGWVRAACAGDVELEAEVLALLEAADEVGDRFERMVDAAARKLDDELPPTEAAGIPAAETAEDLTGQLFGYVQIHGRLGEGGMGRVYRGRDRRLGRKVALKVLRPERASDPRMVERLTREARLLGQLKHPAICQIYDLIRPEGDESGVLGLVLELVEGRRLS
ncbi:MAG: protein kinase, partial [Holophagales bacterium]|nr:protein kinase [Holophagales bacterium]